MDTESQERLVKLLRNQRIGSLGTLRDGNPLVTMVLFVAVPDFSAIYLHTSKLAQHTQDMQRDPRVSLMVAETDTMRADPQLLARISIRGEVAHVLRDSQEAVQASNLYLKKYPQAEYTFQLGDFDFYRIVPRVARYVAGFAKAFNLAAVDLTRAGEQYL